MLAWLLAFAGLVGTVPATAYRANTFARFAHADREAILTAPVDPSVETERTVILMTTPSPFLALTIMPTWQFYYDQPNTKIMAAQMARRAIACERASATSVLIESQGSAIGNHRLEKLFVTDPRPATDTPLYETAAFDAIPRKVSDEGILAVEFDFHQNLDRWPVQFLIWERSALVSMKPPDQDEKLLLAAPVSPHPLLP